MGSTIAHHDEGWARVRKNPAQIQLLARRVAHEVRHLVEHLADGMGSVRSMRRTERRQGDKQFGIGDANVACAGFLRRQDLAPIFAQGIGCIPIKTLFAGLNLSDEAASRSRVRLRPLP